MRVSLTYLYRSNTWRGGVSLPARVRWQNYAATSRIYLHHHSSNKYVLINKLIRRFSLNNNEGGGGGVSWSVNRTVVTLMMRITFSVEAFSKKDSIDIVEIVDKLVDVNLNGIDCDGHSIVREVGKTKKNEEEEEKTTTAVAATATKGSSIVYRIIR